MKIQNIINEIKKRKISTLAKMRWIFTIYTLPGMYYMCKYLYVFIMYKYGYWHNDHFDKEHVLKVISDVAIVPVFFSIGALGLMCMFEILFLIERRNSSEVECYSESKLKPISKRRKNYEPDNAYR